MALWIPAAIAGGTAIASAISQRGNKKNVRNEMNRAKKGMASAESGMESANETVDSYLGDIRGMADTAYASGNQTLDGRYGRELSTTQDRIQANTAMQGNAISQALLARGGDLTGQGAAMMAGVYQQGNQAQSDAINQYKTMNDRMNMIENQRGDNLLAQSLRGAEGVAGRNFENYRMQNALLTNANMMDIQRRQARSQGIMDAGATFLGNYQNF